MTAVRQPATVAEARALAHPLRLRILRLCLDTGRTNRELADRLGLDPATVLHHVRTLVRTGFLGAQEARKGRRGAREIPYRATGKSWTLDVGEIAEVAESGLLAMHDAVRTEMIEAGPDGILTATRLGVTLDAHRLAEVERRLAELIQDLDAWDLGPRNKPEASARAEAEREPGTEPEPGAEPVAIYVVTHRRRERA